MAKKIKHKTPPAEGKERVAQIKLPRLSPGTLAQLQKLASDVKMKPDDVLQNALISFAISNASRPNTVLDLSKGATVPSQGVPTDAGRVENPTVGDVPARWDQAFLGPGKPVVPVFEPSHRDQMAELEPRSFQYVPMINATIVPRIAYGLPSFANLRAYAETTPEVMMCVRILTETMKGFRPKILGPDGMETQETELQYLVEYPDRAKPWAVWLSRFLYNTLVYDAATLYRLRDDDRKVIGLRNVDGSTIFCLIDERGEQPPKGQPAFLQIILGIPKSMLSVEQLIYQPRHLRADAPYGRSPIEDALLPVQTLQALWDYEWKYYQEGNMPDTLMIAPQGWTRTQVQAFEESFNSLLAGNNGLRRRVKFLPYGFSKGADKIVNFNSALYEAAVERVGLMFGVPPSEISARGSRGRSGAGSMGYGGGAARAAESTFFKLGIDPLKQYIEGIFNLVLAENGYHQYRFTLDFVTESPDPELQNKTILDQFQSGIITLNQALDALGYQEVKNGDVRIIRMGNTVVMLDDLLRVRDGGVGAVPPNQQRPEGAAPGLPSAADSRGNGHAETNVQSIQTPPTDEATKMMRFLEYQDRVSHGEVIPPYKFSDLPEQIQRVITKENELGHIITASNLHRYVGGEGIAVVGVPGRSADFYKHCGVCNEDEQYYHAPLTREVPIDFPVQGANESEIVAMTPEGLPPRAALWKPEGGELDDLQDIIGGPQFLREEAAYLLNRAMGFRMVPVAYATHLDGEYGAALMYVNGRKPADDMHNYDPKWIQFGGVHDYIAGQIDRHHGNWLTHPDDPLRPILIDNGLTFPESDRSVPASPFIEAIRGQVFDPYVYDMLQTLRGHEVWDEIASLVGTVAVEHAKERLSQLLQDGMIRQREPEEPTPVTTAGEPSTAHL